MLKLCGRQDSSLRFPLTEIERLNKSNQGGGERSSGSEAEGRWMGRELEAFPCHPGLGAWGPGARLMSVTCSSCSGLYLHLCALSSGPLGECWIPCCRGCLLYAIPKGYSGPTATPIRPSRVNSQGSQLWKCGACSHQPWAFTSNIGDFCPGSCFLTSQPATESSHILMEFLDLMIDNHFKDLHNLFIIKTKLHLKFYRIGDVP